MATIRDEAAQLLRSIYRLHEVEPGFQINTAASYGDIANAAESLVRAARSLHRTAEARCNGIERWDAQARMRLASWTDADEAKADKADARATDRAKAALAAIYGADWSERIDLETQGDPRGAMVKLWAKGASRQGYPRLVA